MAPRKCLVSLITAALAVFLVLTIASFNIEPDAPILLPGTRDAPEATSPPTLGGGGEKQKSIFDRIPDRRQPVHHEEVVLVEAKPNGNPASSSSSSSSSSSNNNADVDGGDRSKDTGNKPAAQQQGNPQTGKKDAVDSSNNSKPARPTPPALRDNGASQKQQQQEQDQQPKQQQQQQQQKRELLRPLFEHEDKCEPQKKILYIKTHKTGSSTLANMFHRFTIKHALKPALPVDNLFYAWPRIDTARIHNVIWRYAQQDPRPTYDILCSAHCRYNPQALDILVPNARYITVLRSPASHFPSSWYYWHVADHIKEVSGKVVTMDEFLAKPDWTLGKPGDKHLLLNSQCFDLGLSSEPTLEQVNGLIKDLGNRFFVLITDYMDESLVLLHKEFCWDLEDILYISLKSSKNKNRILTTEEQLRQDRILALNWADKLLFDHFNKTLWERIDKYPNFDAELEYYRKKRDELSEKCRPLSNLDENGHRQVIEEDRDISELERSCHYALMDSMAFSKHLKWKMGALPSELECHTQGQPRKQVSLTRNLGSGDALLANIFYRVAIRLDLATTIPKGDVSKLTMAKPAEAFRPAYARGKSSPSKYNIVVGVPETTPVTLAQRTQVDSIMDVTGGRYHVLFMRDPLTRFLKAWKTMGIADKLKKRLGPGDYTIEKFVAPDSTLPAALEPRVLNELRDGFMFQFGWKGGAATNELVTEADNLMNAIQTRYIPVIAEHLTESLIIMRRRLCWQDKDILFYPHPPLIPEGGTMERMYADVSDKYSTELIADIRAFVWMEDRLYRRFNDTMWLQYIPKEISFQTEIDLHRKGMQQLELDCKPYENSRDPKTMQEMLTGGSSLEKRCYQSFATEADLQKFFITPNRQPPSRYDYRLQ